MVNRVVRVVAAVVTASCSVDGKTSIPEDAPALDALADAVIGDGHAADGQEADASMTDASPPDSITTDAAPPSVDAGVIAFGDMFTSPPLSPQWHVALAGLSPQGAYSIVGGALHFDSAGPSNDFLVPQTSISCMTGGSPTGNFSTFRGHQIVLDVPIGPRDFTLQFDIGWNSSTPSTHVGQFGVALTDSSHRVLFAGTVIDSTLADAAHLFYFLRDGVSADVCDAPTPAVAGRAAFQVTRAAGHVSISIDGTTVVSGDPFVGDVAHVAIVNNGPTGGTPPSFNFDIYEITGSYQP
jgi:hypothetical protein